MPYISVSPLGWRVVPLLASGVVAELASPPVLHLNWRAVRFHGYVRRLGNW